MKPLALSEVGDVAVEGPHESRSVERRRRYEPAQRE